MSGRPPPKLVSAVVPSRDEEGNLERLYRALAEALEGFVWELIIVDDGSRDKSFEIVLELARQDERVRGIALSRSFGHQQALLAGLEASRGDVVVSLDADLQHPPQLIPELIEAWRLGANVVHTRRRSEGELGWFKRASSFWYYRLFSLLSGVHLEPGRSDFRLLDRRVVDAITRVDEAELFLRGLVSWVGFRSTTIPFAVEPRHWGRSKYGMRRMFRLAGSGITSFSTLPLRIGIGLGFLTSALAGMELLYVLWVAASGRAVAGWASVAGLIALLFGMNFVLLGFLGIYLGQVFKRVQHHPAYLVERTTDELLGRRAGPRSGSAE